MTKRIIAGIVSDRHNYDQLGDTLCYTSDGRETLPVRSRLPWVTRSKHDEIGP